MKEDNEGWIWVIIMVFIVWGGYNSFFGKDKESDYSPSYSSSKDCSSLEPENPYSSGSGHYAGFEWAENRGGASCNGNSNSFNEGCEDYNDQESRHEMCLSR